MRRIAILSLVVVGLASVTLSYLSWSQSLRAQEGPQIILYSGVNFTGRSVVLMDTTLDLPVVASERDGVAEFNWNDEVRSVEVVRGTWRVYQNGRCNTRLDAMKLVELDLAQKEPVGGWSTLVSGTSQGRLRIPNVAAGGFWRDVSSVEFISAENLPDWALDFRR